VTFGTPPEQAGPSQNHSREPQSPQSAWKPPTLEEFLADIEFRKSDAPFRRYNNFSAFHQMLEDTKQAEDPMELISAREMALESAGIFGNVTPTMAWNYHFGDIDAFYTERDAQAKAQAALFNPLPDFELNDPSEHQESRRLEKSPPRPKRAAALAASDVWIGLSPRKRQKRK
jgi:hypothetical protein